MWEGPFTQYFHVLCMAVAILLLLCVLECLLTSTKLNTCIPYHFWKPYSLEGLGPCADMVTTECFHQNYALGGMCLLHGPITSPCQSQYHYDSELV